MIKFKKMMMGLRGKVLPYSIMSLIIFMNTVLAVFALEELPENTVIEESIEQVVEVPELPTHNHLTCPVFYGSGNGIGLSPLGIAQCSLTEDFYAPIRSYENIEEKKRLDAEKKAQEEEQRRIEEEKRKAEELELKRVKQIQSITLSSDITKSSNMTIEQITYMLEGTGLEGTEWAYYKLQEKQGLNIFAIVGISINEAGWDSESYKARVHNNIYGITSGSYQSFKSKQDCIYYFGDFIDRLYIQKGLKTLSKIQPKYCTTNTSWDEEAMSIATKLYNKVISKYKI